MARYDYRCGSCGATFEVEHPMNAHPNISCPACGGDAGKRFSAAGIVFEGSGFYNTDQRKTGSAGDPGKDVGGTAEGSTDGAGMQKPNGTPKSKPCTAPAAATTCASCPQRAKTPRSDA